MMSTTVVHVETVQVRHIALDSAGQPVGEALAEMAGVLTAHYSLILRRIVRDFRGR